MSKEVTDGLIGIVALLTIWRAIGMVRHPERHVGTGSLQASNPRTVQQFGYFFIVLFGAALALILVRFISE